MGYGVLSRSDRRSIERDLQELNEEIVLSLYDSTADASNDQLSTAAHSQGALKKSKMSSVGIFLDSLYRKSNSIVSRKSTETKNTMNEEFSTHRSLARKEYNRIIHRDKDPNAVSSHVQEDL